jgi:hypothetical protein
MDQKTQSTIPKLIRLIGVRCNLCRGSILTPINDLYPALIITYSCTRVARADK